jgi:membrane protease YdiL (CAAX protease family)
MSEKEINVLQEEKSKFPPIPVFFILTFFITWGFMLLTIYPLNIIYQMRSWDSFIGVLCHLFTGIQSYGPFIAAVLTILYSEGKEGLKRFGKRLIKLNVKFYWYLIVFLLPIVAYFVPILINLIFGNPYDLSYFEVSMWGIDISVILINIVFAGIAEEPGWRGYAVPEMNKKYRPIVTGAIIGFFWAIWHLLLYVYGGRPWETFPQFVFTVTVISCIYTWIFMKTESVPLMIIFHVMHNLSNRVFINYHKPIWGGLVYLVILIVIVIFDRKNLFKKPISSEIAREGVLTKLEAFSSEEKP